MAGRLHIFICTGPVAPDGFPRLAATSRRQSTLALHNEALSCARGTFYPVMRHATHGSLALLICLILSPQRLSLRHVCLF